MIRVNHIECESPAGNPRRLLSDWLRHDLGLTGTHVGCEHGVCGACTVLLDGKAVRSCLLLAVQAEGHEVTTIEALTPRPEDPLSPVQQAFKESHGLQCGFCTPGFVIALTSYLETHPSATDEELEHAISGNLCRCTGYAGIRLAARRARDLAAAAPART